MLDRERAANPEQQGGCVLGEVQEFRFATVRTFMGCGVALNKLDAGMGKLLNRAGLSTTSSSDMRQYVPMVTEAEIEELILELRGQWVCLIFDGTTRLGEIVCLLVRFCTSDFRIVHRLVGLVEDLQEAHE